MLVQLIYYTNNMSYLDTLKKYKLLNEEVDKTEDETVEEMSTSAGAGAYETPMAFGDVSDDTIEMMGYKKVKKVNILHYGNKNKYMEINQVSKNKIYVI